MNDIFLCIFRVKDGELPVLPLSVYGAVVMAHSEASEEYSSPNQFFFYLYDKRNVSPISTWVYSGNSLFWSKFPVLSVSSST